MNSERTHVHMNHTLTTQYAILRLEKLKSFGNIAGSLAHTYRTRETPNADPDRFHQNTHSVDKEAVLDKIKARLPEKRRKDAVLALEYLITASPEFFVTHIDNQSTIDQYFNESVKWLNERHGSENVVSWHIHDDETSPHLVAYVVPIDQEGRLNARHFTGGRAALSKMQTDFAKKVGAQVKLERGVEGSTAKHTDIKDYYAALNNPHPFPPPLLTNEELATKKTKKGLFSDNETLEAKYQRINNTILERFNGISWVNYAHISAELKKRLESAKKRLIDEEQKRIRAETEIKNIASEKEQLAMTVLQTQRKLKKSEESVEQLNKKLTEQDEIIEYFRNKKIELETELNQYRNNNQDETYTP
jgi:hypothetical protein